MTTDKLPPQGSQSVLLIPACHSLSFLVGAEILRALGQPAQDGSAATP